MKKTSVASATNLTELLRNESTGALLTVNGFSENCSDFEWLQRFCVCASRMPNAALVKTCQAALFDWLGADLPLDLQHCGMIWKETANRLLLEQEGKGDFEWRFPQETEIPKALRSKLSNTLDVGALLSPRPMRWKDWEKEAEQQLEASLSRNVAPLLRLSLATDPKKPNLYRVERILSGEEDLSMWQVQCVAFLLHFCKCRGIRPMLEGDCKNDRMLELLCLCAELTPLPCLNILPINGISWEGYVSLCDAVMRRRGALVEGEPPILLCGVERFLDR